MFVVLLAFGSCKKHHENTLTLVRDCTATYLRDENIDLPIVNAQDLAHIDSGQTVVVRYYFPSTKKVEISYDDDCGIPHTYPRGEWIIIEEFNQ